MLTPFKDTNLLDVEFEWFDPQPAYDFHGIKTLLRQLFEVDAEGMDLSALTDLILAQPLLGSTVKVEGNETDPYAFLSILNLKEHQVGIYAESVLYLLTWRFQEKPVIRNLQAYLIDRARSSKDGTQIADVLNSTSNAVGLILTERLINIPSEVVPPMYKMLLEEITWALAEKEPYRFSHYLVLSKTYLEGESELDEVEASSRKNKKQKRSRHPNAANTFYFHREDEVLQKSATSWTGFDYTGGKGGESSDTKKTFQELGIVPQGHLILLDAKTFEAAVNDMQKLFHQP